MKFAHISDVHLGGWRDPRLRDANASAFKIAIQRMLDEQVDFVLIAGDLFNTAVPGIDSVRLAVEQLRKLKDANIPVYFIAGSHDFSASGKTMLDVLEHARLAKNVARGEEVNGKIKLKWTVDEKTGAKMAGMIGKKGGLEKEYYKFLDRESLESEDGFKIFMFHTALVELKPKGLEQMDAMETSLLPRGCDYYAGGHVHIIENVSIDGYQNIIYPGPVFPNNIAELEKLRAGNMMLYEDGKITRIPISPCNVICTTIDTDARTASEAESLIRKELARDCSNAVVTVRVQGCLAQGKPADIPWSDVLHDAYARGALAVLRNTAALTSKEFQIIAVKEANVEDVEQSLLQEHSGQFKLSSDDAALTKKAMSVLSAEKHDGEKIFDFENRVTQEMDKLFE